MFTAPCKWPLQIQTANSMDAIEIQLSKKKIVFLLIGAIVFVVLGLLFVLNAESFSRGGPVRNPAIISGVGWAGILFFGLIAGYGATKMFDKNAGLRIDDAGITDNSNATSTGLIAWEDITAIRIVKVVSTSILLIDVKNPEAYVARAKNTFNRKLLQANLDNYGTPISITSTSLKIGFQELEGLLKREWEKRRN